ncbi:hypothetical protein Q31a_01460 [Aureliella helgolandensis]|uniref:Uncharacterized protein n=1 Tax=Aureliella helgolandensis TaxID=2527968 RepID=A0A518FZS6_9BACT|nr:hypothetical protein Q31a_01460 [Aureliella helgolandensis]
MLGQGLCLGSHWAVHLGSCRIYQESPIVRKRCLICEPYSLGDSRVPACVGMLSRQCNSADDFLLIEARQFAEQVGPFGL